MKRLAQNCHYEADGTHLYTGEVTYNGYNELSAFREKVGTSGSYETAFTYDNESKPTEITYGDTSHRVTYTYDAIGRTASRTTQNGSSTYTTAYTYVTGSNGGNTTGLIAGISQSGESSAYTYDACGNILTETRNGTVTRSYTYDKLNRLTKVSDPEDGTSGGTNGTVWTYSYDRGGNILNKKCYVRASDGSQGSLVKEYVYSYDFTHGEGEDARAWMDVLTGYDGNTITYDTIGNTLSDGTWTYTWEKGRQLRQMSKTGRTVTFEYNSEGLRVRKTVNDTADGITVTEYTLHGKNIVHMTVTNTGLEISDSMHFWYDAGNRPVMVEYNGTRYTYIYNLQGDVIGLLDAGGTEVVHYTYDAWGKVLGVTGDAVLIDTVGKNNRYYIEDTVMMKIMQCTILKKYYSPIYKRFINVDPLFDGNNIYIYCLNNPISFIDPNGTIVEILLFGAILVGTINYDLEIRNSDNIHLNDVEKNML